MRLLITVIALATLAACAPADNADPNLTTPSRAGSGSKPAKPASTTRTVTYRVGGTASSGSITYTTPSGQEQQNDADLPWKKTFKVNKGSFEMLDVSVQNSGSGTVTCEIWVDGKRVKAAKSSGEFAIASCDHSLGF